MLKVLFVSTECYPYAKAGGMGDVVGALPKYLRYHDVDASVILPVYDRPLFHQHFEVIFESQIDFPDRTRSFQIREYQNQYGFSFYGVHCEELFFRESIYLGEDGHGYPDEIHRNLFFQRAILTWWNIDPNRFDLVHCHDHMTGFIPFFLKYGRAYPHLVSKPSFFTVHNAIYRGRMPWSFSGYLGSYDEWKWGLLDWSGKMDGLASALRCADKVNVVSPNYLKELVESGHELEWIFNEFPDKFVGLLNGVDVDVWSPETDQHIVAHKTKGIADFKKRNKAPLTSSFSHRNLPLFCFIGRFAHQKGVDILIDAIRSLLSDGMEANFALLGSGDRQLEEQVFMLAEEFEDHVHYESGYNEPYSHQLYAGSDFLLMPSREEPCGLNQMFAMRYGTIPIVHATGGLVDTVPDIDVGGNGFAFSPLSVYNLQAAIIRAVHFYGESRKMSRLRNKVIDIDFSWRNAAGIYAKEYYKLMSDE